MWINGRFFSRPMLFAPNEGVETTGGGAGNPDTTPEGKDPDPNGGKDKGGNETVPYGRFKEVNDENKSLKARLAEFESIHKSRNLISLLNILYEVCCWISTKVEILYKF